MAKSANNMRELEFYLLNAVKDTMENEVAHLVKEEQSRQVHKEVYRKYTPNNGEPWVYKRRKDKKGLSSTENMEAIFLPIGIRGYEMQLFNWTPSDDGTFNIADLVEGGQRGLSGNSYSYLYNRSGDADDYLRPRPFMQKTQEDIESNDKVVNVFKRGMRRNGFDTY